MPFIVSLLRFVSRYLLGRAESRLTYPCMALLATLPLPLDKAPPRRLTFHQIRSLPGITEASVHGGQGFLVDIVSEDVAWSPILARPRLLGVKMNVPHGTAAVRRLLAHSEINFLKLTGDGVNDALISEICKAMPRLTDLRIESAAVTDLGVAELKDCGMLQSLELHHASISGRSAQILAKMEQLDRLELTGADFSDADLSNFVAAPRLAFLIHASPVSHKAVEGVKRRTGAEGCLSPRGYIPREPRIWSDLCGAKRTGRAKETLVLGSKFVGPLYRTLGALQDERIDKILVDTPKLGGGALQLICGLRPHSPDRPLVVEFTARANLLAGQFSSSKIFEDAIPIVRLDMANRNNYFWDGLPRQWGVTKLELRNVDANNLGFKLFKKHARYPVEVLSYSVAARDQAKDVQP